jgi:arylsulfatase A-like enzyme
MATDFWTLPTHASILTGQYPSDHQATSETNHLQQAADTLAERLARSGYRTGAFVANAWVSGERGFAQGFDTFEEAWSKQNASPRSTLDQRTIRAARAWIAKHSQEDAPFFAMLNLTKPHLPYAPHPASLSKVAHAPWPKRKLASLRKIKGMWSYLAGATPLDESDFEIMRTLYAAEVISVDQMIGSLVKLLEEEEILDETLIIVTSDHGENIGDHGMIDHLLSMYESTIHIPLIMRYPARFSAGSENTSLTSQIDIMPTVIDIAGLGNLYPGSLERSLANAKRPPRDFVIAENDRPLQGMRVLRKRFPDFDAKSIDGRIRMLRTDRHKLIWHSNRAPQLFDLQSDPTETHDLAATNPDLRDRMLAQLTDWMNDRTQSNAPSDFETDDPEAIEQLKQLGYLE